MRLESRSALEFFREKIQKAQENQNLPLHETTQFYVVNLLSEFIQAGKLLTSGPSRPIDEPLALLYGRAVETPSENERFQLLKTIGDRSLYVSGFFSDSLRRKLVDIDYYIAMGENAYTHVSSIAREKPRGDLFSELYSELAMKFVRLVDLLAEISESVALTSDQDLLRLYERWLHTKSVRLSKKLKEQGIDPINVSKGPLH